MTEALDALEMTPLLYSGGFKYQTRADFHCQTSFRPANDIETKWICLSKSGYLFIKHGYAWDGPSGPTIDTVNSMRGSLVHDAIYQLMRMELLGPEWRTDADALLDIVLEGDGMWSLRRWYWLRGVEWFAGGAIKPENVKVIHTAP